MQLAGKVAVVSGAGGGIGQAICVRYLAEGAAVVAIDINGEAAEAAVASASGGRALALACDATESDQVEDAVRRAKAEFGAVNVLTNIAGGSTPADGSVTEAPVGEFWRVMNLDLFGTFLACRHGVPELIAAGGGSVVNLTSALASVAVPGRSCYIAAKGGVASLTRAIAVDYAGQGVRANAIAPGIVLTPRVRAMHATSQASQDFSDRHLLGLATPEDVAGMAVYLASDDSRRVTGQIMHVDSGVSAH